MKNICFLIGNLNSSGGTERVTSLIANELSKREDCKILMLSLIDGTEPFFSLNTNISIYSLYKKNISFKKKIFNTIWKIRQFVKNKSVDTLIVVDSISCIFTVPALFGLNVNHICWEHFHFKNNNGIARRDYGRKLAAKYCNHIVTLTEKDLNFWKMGLNNVKANIVCIPNPTPYSNIENSPSLSYKTVLTIGRLTEVKGYDLLIKAWKIVCDTTDGWTLCIVGEGVEENNLREMATSLGIDSKINFAGHTSNVEKFYKNSSIFCLSSRNEGLPMVLLEAQAYGLPIVSFDCDTGPSEIVVNMENGLLVENGNIDSLAFSLKELINLDNEKYQNFVTKSFFVIEKFNIKNILDKWCVIL